MNEKLKRISKPVTDEIYQLLLTAYCYNRKIKLLGERLQEESRDFLLEELTALRHLSNGIILHLCTLDDESSWSLRSLRKELAKSTEFKDKVERSNELLKTYRTNLNTFKTKHRNDFIAHRNIESYPDPFQLPDYRKEFKDLIELAVLTLDYMSGEVRSYGFNLGSRDPTIDFKEELGLSEEACT
jgi:hypothetical protein